MRYEIRPLGMWVDPVTEHPRSSPFRANWNTTLALLLREAEMLGAPVVAVQVDITEGDLRRDGMLRANARVGHPGVVVSFTSRLGPLRYATDAYDDWRANLRAIALALEALRAVDRYGVSRRGEQYVGWKALPAAQHEPNGAAEALEWMRDRAEDLGFFNVAAADPAQLYRFLARRYHPDNGGDPDLWDRLDKARRLTEGTS